MSDVQNCKFLVQVYLCKFLESLSG